MLLLPPLKTNAGRTVHKNHCPIEMGLTDSCFSWKMPQIRAFGHCVFGRCENAVERLQNSDFSGDRVVSQPGDP